MIPHRFKVDLPEQLVIEALKAKDNQSVKEIGIEWCVQQSKEIIAAGFPVVHYYSMSKSETIKQVAKAVF